MEKSMILSLKMIFRTEKFLKAPFYYLPEGKIKILCRKIGFRMKNSLPYGMMVNKGETIISVGIPEPRNVEKFRKLIGKRGKLILIEPERNNINRIKNHIKSNGWKNVFLIEKAAWDKEEILNFKISIKSSDHKIPIENIIIDNDLDPKRRYIKEIKVEAIRLDNLLNITGKVNFMYITVNGAELKVLQGALIMLKKYVPRLWVKGHALLNNRPLNVKIVEFLESIGYSTLITTHSKGIIDEWRKRAGDIYAWKD